MTEKLKILAAAILRSMTYHFQIWAGVAVIAVIALVSWLFLHEADVGTRQAADELVQLSGNIRRYYQNRPDFWGLSTDTVIKNKIYPQEMLQNGRLNGFFGNEVLIGRGPDAEVLMPGARGFDIIYKNLNKKQCEELASYKFDEKFWLGITGITVGNDKEQRYFTWSDKEFALPIKKDFVQSICKSANILIWHCE